MAKVDELRKLRNKLGFSYKTCEKLYGVPTGIWKGLELGNVKNKDYRLNLLIEKMEKDYSIVKLVKACADLLGVNCPKIDFDYEAKKVGNLAGLDNGILKVVHDYDNIYDIYFAICHEMRHLYQLTYNQDIFKNYIELSDEIDTEKYNLQAAEIDANAFATIFIEQNIGVRPLFLGYSDKVKEKIFERVDELRGSIEG